MVTVKKNPKVNGEMDLCSDPTCILIWDISVNGSKYCTQHMPTISPEQDEQLTLAGIFNPQ